MIRRHGPRANGPSIGTGLVGLGAMAALVAVWPKGQLGNPRDELALLLAAVAATMAAWDLLVVRVWRQRDANIGPLRPRGEVFDAGLVEKLAGLAVIYLGAAALWMLVPLWQDFIYQPFFDLVTALLPVLVPASVLYVVALHAVRRDAGDHLAALGQVSIALVGQREIAAAPLLAARDLVLATLVKLFFLPLMFSFAMEDWLWLIDQAPPVTDFATAFEVSVRALYFVDVSFALIGYTMALRLLNAHVRAPERSISGWTVCLACYPPFWQVIGRDFLDYGGGIGWQQVFGGPLAVVWGCLILATVAAFVACTVCFGLRFSNLTDRGIVCHGPYALTRHPAYVAKIAAMLLIELPFLAETGREAASHMLALGGVVLIYVLRARHESALLRQGRDYRVYERWIARHGLAARLARAVRVHRAGRGTAAASAALATTSGRLWPTTAGVRDHHQTIAPSLNKGR